MEAVFAPFEFHIVNPVWVACVKVIFSQLLNANLPSHKANFGMNENPYQSATKSFPTHAMDD
jgi:hypothetical protein